MSEVEFVILLFKFWNMREFSYCTLGLDHGWMQTFTLDINWSNFPNVSYQDRAPHGLNFSLKKWRIRY